MSKNEENLTRQQDETVKKELGLNEIINLDTKETTAIEKEADDFAEMLLNISKDDFDKQDNVKNAIEGLGIKIQEEAAHKSQMLKAPNTELSQKGAEGSDVGNALVELQMKVEDLDPNKINFS